MCVSSAGPVAGSAATLGTGRTEVAACPESDEQAPRGKALRYEEDAVPLAMSPTLRRVLAAADRALERPLLTGAVGNAAGAVSAASAMKSETVQTLQQLDVLTRTPTGSKAG
jgi:hypothetical protein